MASGSGGRAFPRGTVDAGTVFCSRDLGEAWERLQFPEIRPSRMFEVSIDRAAPSRVYCCNWFGQVYSSQDGGTSWAKSQIPFEAGRRDHVYAMVCG